MTNKIQHAFENIQADTRLKEATKQALAAKRRKKSHRKTGVVLTLACMVLSFIAGMQAYAWIQTPVSYVSIDVNPSMELTLNSLDRVVSASPYNDEGAEILNGLRLKGKKCTDAIKMILESSAMDTYLANNPDLVFTVASNKDREVPLETSVTDVSRETGHNCHSVSTDIETAAQAHDNGLSLGKYNAYLYLAQYDDTVTIDQCKDMSMSEIHRLIRDHQQEEHPVQKETPLPKEIPPQEETPLPSEESRMDGTSTTTHEQGDHHHHGGHH